MFNDYCPPSRLHYLIWHTPVAEIVWGTVVGTLVGMVVFVSVVVSVRLLLWWVFGLPLS